MIISFFVLVLFVVSNEKVIPDRRTEPQRERDRQTETVSELEFENVKTQG